MKTERVPSILLAVVVAGVMSVCGCAYIADWWHDNPIPTPIPTTTTTTIPADGFVFGNWTWFGRNPCQPTAQIAPNAKCISAVVRGEPPVEYFIYPVFDPIAHAQQWWPPRDATTYGHQCCAWKEGGQWYAALVETYPMAVRDREEFKNPFKMDTPFHTAGHPFVWGCEAWWWVENEAGTLVSTPVKIKWE